MLGIRSAEKRAYQNNHELRATPQMGGSAAVVQKFLYVNSIYTPISMAKKLRRPESSCKKLFFI